MKVEISVQGDTMVARCSGRLVAGVAGNLYDEVKPLLANSKRVVLDLTEVDQMDSLGLGTVMRLYVSAKSAGCQLELINLSKRVRELFSITNVMSLFEVYGDHPRIP